MWNYMFMRFTATDREVLIKNEYVSLLFAEAFHNQGQHTAAIEPSYLLSEFTRLDVRENLHFL